MWKILAVLLIGSGLGAAVTVPSEEKAEALMKDQIMQAVARQEIGGSTDAIAAAALIGCKLQPDGCYKMLRSQIDTVYENRWVYAAFQLQGFGKRAACYGAFNRFWCPGGLQDAKP